MTMASSTGISSAPALIPPSLPLPPPRCRRIPLLKKEDGTVETQNEVPGVHTSYVLFNSVTGQTLASMDGTELTLRRTAAVSALASHYLSNKNSELLMIGAGALAPHLIRSHLTTRPSINHVNVWNRTSQKSKNLVEEFRKESGMEGVRFEVCEDLQSAVAMADIVSSAMNSGTPLIMGEWVKAGAHLDLVGSYKPSMRECDDEAVRKGRVFVDGAAAMLEAGELVAAFAGGVMTENDVEGESGLIQRCRESESD